MKKDLQASRYHRAKLWEIAFFSLNNSATNIYLFAFSFVTYYSTGLVGLAVLAVSSIMGGIRIFDGAIDPAIGVMIDKLETKFGKYRPVMLIGNIVLIFSFILLFNTHQFNGSLKFMLFLVALIIHKIGYSFQASCTKAAQTVLTNDPEQRPLFSVFDTVFSGIGIFTLGQIVISQFLAPRHGGNFDQAFFTELIAGVIGISAVLTILAIIGIARKDRKEYFGLGEQTVETKGIKDYWAVLKGNRPLQSLAISAALMKFVSTLISDAVIIIMLFAITLGNYGLSGQISAMQVIPNFIIVFLLAKTAGKKGMKFTYSLSSAIALFSFIAFGAVLLTAGNPMEIFTAGGWRPMAVIGLFICIKIFTAFPTSQVLTMAADVSDYETAKSGRYVSGLIGTIFSFIDSLSSSLTPIIVGWIAISIGYNNAYPAATDPFNAELFKGTLIGFVAIPVVLLACVLGMMRFYSLDKETMEKIQVAIDEKKNTSVTSMESVEVVAVD